MQSLDAELAPSRLLTSQTPPEPPLAVDAEDVEESVILSVLARPST